MQVSTISQACTKQQRIDELVKKLLHQEEQRKAIVVILDESGSDRFKDVFFSLTNHGFSKDESFELIKNGLSNNLTKLEDSISSLLGLVHDL